jgi:hypothetical protein
MRTVGLCKAFFLSSLVLPACLLLAQSQSAARPPSSEKGEGRLAVYAENPRYLQDAHGKPVFILGYNDSWKKQPPAVLDQLQGKVNYLRTAYASNNDLYFPIDYEVGNPIVKRSSGLWDFDLWDERFWSNLQDYLNNTKKRGFIVGFIIWDGHWSLPEGKAGHSSLWNSNKNVQGIQWAYDYDALINYSDPKSNSTDSRERLVYYQRRWIDRFIDEVRGFPHVLIELDNETHQASESWWLWWADYFIRKGNFVIATTWNSKHTISDSTFSKDSRLHMKSYHKRSDDEITSTRLSWNKIIAADADTSGIDLDEESARRIAWKSLMKGGHWNDYMEGSSYPKGNPFPNSTKISYYGTLLNFLITRSVPFAEMSPDDRLVSTGNALAKPGSCYLVYVEAGIKLVYFEAGVQLNLSGASGRLHYEWYDPKSGTTAASGQVQGGAIRAFSPPSRGDLVLWVHKADSAVAVSQE